MFFWTLEYLNTNVPEYDPPYKFSSTWREVNLPPETGSPKKKGGMKYRFLYVIFIFNHKFVILGPKEKKNSEKKIKKEKKKKKPRQVSYYNIWLLGNIWIEVTNK